MKLKKYFFMFILMLIMITVSCSNTTTSATSAPSTTDIINALTTENSIISEDISSSEATLFDNVKIEGYGTTIHTYYFYDGGYKEEPQLDFYLKLNSTELLMEPPEVFAEIIFDGADNIKSFLRPSETGAALKYDYSYSCYVSLTAHKDNRYKTVKITVKINGKEQTAMFFGRNLISATEADIWYPSSQDQ